jgi:hypothetical protein
MSGSVVTPLSFTCPVCRAVSYNLNDVREGYCGRCHSWTGRELSVRPCPVTMPHSVHQTWLWPAEWCPGVWP